MMNPTEIVVQKRLTREFIHADGISVELVRSTAVSTPNGGTQPGVPVTIDSQTFRLVPASSSAFSSLREKIEGDIPQEGSLLIGVWNADIEQEDTFEFDGKTWEIKFISTDRTYETVASAMYRG